MRVLITLFILLLFSINTSIAYELVSPKEKKSMVNTKYAFFFGKASSSESIFINDSRIYIAPNGAFAHSVKLKDGENRVVIRSNFSTQVYKIYKTSSEQAVKPKLIEFPPCIGLVNADNTPLRSTSVDYGMNRVSHLFKGTLLVINGEMNGFYRVFLSKTREAWISKNSVQLQNSSNAELKPEFLNMNSETFKNATVHNISFTQNLPYTIDETDSEIIFKVYNPMFSEDSVYTLNIRKPEKYSYKTTLVDGSYTIKVNELPNTPPKSLEGLNIIIDAGHGGTERGAIGCLGDKEKDINLKIAQELKDQLCLLGANVFMTRECDGTISLDERVRLARENNSNIFVSVHLNSIPDIEMNVHKNRGTSVYYYNPNSKSLAKSVLDSIVKGLGTRNDGVKTASFAVIRPTDYVGILVEVAYMTNPIDSVLYTSESFARDTAKSIAEGIFNYVNQEM